MARKPTTCIRWFCTTSRMRAGLLVEAAAALHAEGLGHGDLHALHVVPVPDRLEEGVGEAEDEEVLHRLLAQVVVDAEDGWLGEDGVERRVERLRRGEVAAEGLLDDHPRVPGAARAAQVLDRPRGNMLGGMAR